MFYYELYIFGKKRNIKLIFGMIKIYSLEVKINI